MMSDKAFTVWFTGLSRSGKSTLAQMLHDSLTELDLQSEILDTGSIRQRFSSALGFTREDIGQHLRRVAYECEMLNRNAVIAIVAAISPYRAQRSELRGQIQTFVEVYCDAPVEELSAIIRREFEVKAPTGAEIATRAASGDYADRYELVRDLGVYLFWMNRNAMAMYDK